MKFHLFSRSSCSSDFATRLGHLITFEADTITEIFIRFVEYRYEYFDWDEEFTKEELKLKFIQKLFRRIEPFIPRTPKGMLMMVNKIKEESEIREIFDSVNEDINGIEPLLIVEETKENSSLLHHLGIGEKEESEEEEEPPKKTKPKPKKKLIVE